MITYYKLTAGEVVTTPDTDAPILLVIDPTAEEKLLLMNSYQIDEHNLASTQDPFELPRLEVEDNHLAVIFKEPKRYSSRDNFVFLINAVGLFLYRDRLIVVASSDFAGFKGRAFRKFRTSRCSSCAYSPPASHISWAIFR